MSVSSGVLRGGISGSRWRKFERVTDSAWPTGSGEGSGKNAAQKQIERPRASAPRKTRRDPYRGMIGSSFEDADEHIVMAIRSGAARMGRAGGRTSRVPMSWGCSAVNRVTAARTIDSK